MNAWKHGERSAEAVGMRAMFMACLRALREGDLALADLNRRYCDCLD